MLFWQYWRKHISWICCEKVGRCFYYPLWRLFPLRRRLHETHDWLRLTDGPAVNGRLLYKQMCFSQLIDFCAPYVIKKCKCLKKKKATKQHTSWAVWVLEKWSPSRHHRADGVMKHFVFCTYVYQRVGAFLQCQYCCFHALLCFAWWQYEDALMNASLGFGDSPTDVARSRISDFFFVFVFLRVNEGRVILLWRTRTSADFFLYRKTFTFDRFQFPQARRFSLPLCSRLSAASTKPFL